MAARLGTTARLSDWSWSQRFARVADRRLRDIGEAKRAETGGEELKRGGGRESFLFVAERDNEGVALLTRTTAPYR